MNMKSIKINLLKNILMKICLLFWNNFYQNKANIQYNNPLATSEQGSLNVKFEISTIFYAPYLKVVKVEDTETAQTWNFAI